MIELIELKKEELMKNRGYTATLSAGYHMLADNFKAIFRHIWAYALVFALVMGAWTVFETNFENPEDQEMTAMMGVKLLVAVIAVIVVAIAFSARATMLLNEQSMRWNVGRVTKLLGFSILLSIILSLVILALVFYTGGAESAATAAAAAEGAEIEAMQPNAAIGLVQMFFVVGVVIILALIFYLPFLYTVPKYLVETESKLFPTLFGKYGRGLRHWGYIFVCMLLLSLCIGVCSIILMLPMYVVQMVQRLNQVGMLGGDESGLPSWFGWLNFGVSTVTYFVYSFISLIELFVCYYIYGSIETRHREKQLIKTE